MSAELSSPSRSSSRDIEPLQVNGEIHCAITGRTLAPDEVYWAPPLITARALIATMWQTLLSAPGNVGQVLLGEQPNVPYAPEARKLLAERRSIEQLKLLSLLLLLAAALIVPIVMLVV